MFKQSLLLLTGFLAGLTIAVGINSTAQGLRLEVGAGISKAVKPAEGMWYQSDLPHNFQLKDRAYSIGLSGDTPLSDLRWATRYVNLGHFSSRAIANADDNDDFTRRGAVSSNPHRPECANSFAADCHYNWNGTGSVRGIAAVLGAEPLKIGPVHIGIESGMFLYKATWRETISPIDCPGNQCWEMQIDKRTPVQIGPTLGLSARWDYLYIAARSYWVPEKLTAGFRGPVRQFEMGFSIPL